MNVSVTIDTKDVDRFLKSAPEQLHRIIDNVIRKVAFLVERYSKLQAPVDTGRLRSSIGTSFAPLKATVAPHVSYAVFVHNGTRYIKSNPFMTKGGDEAQGQVDGIVQSELKTLQ